MGEDGEIIFHIILDMTRVSGGTHTRCGWIFLLLT
jgi:hypothetical protein